MDRESLTGADPPSVDVVAPSTPTWLVRLAAACSVAPLFVAAVRNGRRGWVPTWDAATVAVRVRDVFGAHPPLYGLVVSSSPHGQVHSYLGAPEFYLLALPVRLLGTTWGLLLGMALIQSAALLVSLWLIRRRIGDRGTVLAAACIATLLWTLGSEFIVDPTPVQAVTLPFFTLLVAAWSVAEDDPPSLLVLAIVGNYLVLTHPAMIIVTPTVCGTALVLLALRWRSARPTRDGERPEPGYRRSRLRWLAAAIAAALIMWIPPIYEQSTSPNGNLGLFLHGVLTSGGDHGAGTVKGALGVVSSVIAVPPMWLPPNFVGVPFDSTGGGQPVWTRVVSASILLLLVGLAVRWSRRHRRPTVPRAFIVAGGAVVGWIVTWKANPNTGRPAFYFWGLWPLSTFVWFILVYVGATALVDRLVAGWNGDHKNLRRIGAVLCGVTIVLPTALALPRRNHCAGECASSVDLVIGVASDLRRVTARDLRGERAVLVPPSASAGDLMATVQPALVLGLQDAQVPLRVATRFDARQFGAPIGTPGGSDATVRLEITNRPVPAVGARLLGRFHYPSVVGPTEYARVNDAIIRSLRTGPSTTDLATRQMHDHETDFLYWYIATVFAKNARYDPGPRPLARFMASLELVGLRPDGRILEVPGLTPGEVRDWAIQTARPTLGTFYLYAIPMDRSRR